MPGARGWPHPLDSQASGKMRCVGFSLSIAAAMLCNTPLSALAAEGASPATVSANGGIVSDYRFRGVSLSGRDPAVQGGLTVGAASGLYAGLWGSTIRETAGGAEAEVDLTAGYAGDIGGGFSADVHLAYYLFPGDGSIDYLEGHASLSYALGPLTPTLGMAYAPRQGSLRDALGTKADNFYVYGGADLAVPGTAATLIARIGHETGPLATSDGGKWDWQLGGTVAAWGLTFGLSYVDSNVRVPMESGRNLGGAGVIASVFASF